MAVTNLMQEIVVSTLEEVLKNEKITNIPPADRDDIIAYALNRLNPKYVTSERGLLHGVLEARYQVQQRVDVLFLIYEALYRILNHPASSAGHSDMSHSKGTVMLPHIVGQVLDSETLSMLPNVDVLLLHNGAPAPMIDDGWNNPYRTNESTNGYYHFWPKYADSHGSAASLPFTLVFKHPEFKETSMSIDLEVIGAAEPGKNRFLQATLMDRI